MRPEAAVEPAAASPSCPRCGAGCAAGTASCRACGFAIVQTAERSGFARGRRSGRVAPGGRMPAAAVAAAAAVLAAVLLLADGDPPPPAADPVPVLPPPPSPVSAQAAERELELRFGTIDDEAAAVRCPRRVEPSRTVRCELRYKDGIARALLVRISPRGELEADIPYPATIRR